MMQWIESFLFENDEKSEIYYSKGIESYPDCPLFAYVGGYVKRKRGYIDEAAELFNKVFNMSIQFHELQVVTGYEIGWCYLLQLNWSMAIEKFEAFLPDWTSSGIKAFCYYQLGYAYHMVDETEKAVEVLSKVKAAARKNYSFDEYATLRAKQYLKRGLPNNRKELFIIELLSVSRNEESLDYINNSEVINDDEYPEEQAMALYYKGLVLRTLKKNRRGKRML